MASAMASDLAVRRRRRRGTPLRERRLGEALYAAPRAGVDPAADFPGLDVDPSGSRRGQIVSSGLSFAVHAGLLAALLLLAWLAPVEEIEELIELQRVQDEVAKQEPAARPRVVQERASPVFDPAAMAVAPQIVNPVVVQQKAPAVTAQKIDVESVSTVTAPTEIARAAPVVVEQARAYQSVAPVVTQPVAVEGVAPAVRGPIEHVAPVGIQSGPKQVASGSTAGIADARALGTGSSVREGIVTGRDVHGAETGARAEVHWAVGSGNLRGGGGGDGSGPGGVSFDDCMRRPEVQAYMARIKDRMYSRWSLPADVPGNLTVELSFVLDPAGTARSVKFVSTQDNRLGQSAVDALRAASPFDHMSDRVRCLANATLVGTFRNPVTSATN